MLFDARGNRLRKAAGFVSSWSVDRDRGGNAHVVGFQLQSATNALVLSETAEALEVAIQRAREATGMLLEVWRERGGR